MYVQQYATGFVWPKLDVSCCADDIAVSYPPDDLSWRDREMEHFTTHRDKNKNGVLSVEEIAEWLFPPHRDPWVNEAKHLIYHADTNKVSVVTHHTLTQTHALTLTISIKSLPLC